MDEEQQARQWCQAAAKGDRGAATQLLQNFYGRVFAYLRRLSRNDTDAADLTQETFTKVWHSLGKFREQSRVSTWIHRIAYCTWVDWVRQQRPTNHQPDTWWLDLPDPEPTPEQQAELNDRRLRLWILVAALPEEQCQAIHLRYGQQLSLMETAEILKMPLSTLKLRLRTALKTLNSRVKESQRLQSNRH